MAQEVLFRKEQVDNLDKVEPYGATADARATSQTANFFSNISAQFGRLLGNQSMKMAKQQAMNLAFEYDEETGMPVMPERYVAGGLKAMEVYQQGIEARYEDHMLSSLQDNLKRIAIKYPENEEMFRQEAAIAIGAMASKVAQPFQGVFQDNAVQLETGIATDIALARARADRIRSRAANRSNTKRSSDALGPMTPEQAAIVLADLQQSPGWDDLDDATKQQMLIDAGTKMLQGVGTGALNKPKPVELDAEGNPVIPEGTVDGEIEATSIEDAIAQQAVNETTTANIKFATKTQKDQRLLSAFTDMVREPSPSLSMARYMGLTDSDQRSLADNVFPGLQGQPEMWVNPAIMQSPDMKTVHANFLEATNGQGILLPQQEDAFDVVLSGQAHPAMVINSMATWADLRGNMVGPSSFAAENPTKAAALDVMHEIYLTQGAGAFAGENGEENVRRLSELSKTASNLTPTQLNGPLDLEPTATIDQRRDAVRQVIREKYKHVKPGKELEALVSRSLAHNRYLIAAGDSPDTAKKIIKQVIEGQYVDAPGFTRGEPGVQSGKIPNNLMPRISSYKNTSGSEIIRQAMWHVAVNNGIELSKHDGSAKAQRQFEVKVYDADSVGIVINGQDMGIIVDVSAIQDRIDRWKSDNGIHEAEREANLARQEVKNKSSGAPVYGQGQHAMEQELWADEKQKVKNAEAKLIDIDLDFIFEGFVGKKVADGPSN